MAVYVDPLLPTTPTQSWPFQFSARLTADTLPELHNMARALYLKREWYNGSASIPFYYLNSKHRTQAIASGAVQLSKAESARRCRDVLKKRRQAAQGSFLEG